MAIDCEQYTNNMVAKKKKKTDKGHILYRVWIHIALLSLCLLLRDMNELLVLSVMIKW